MTGSKTCGILNDIEDLEGPSTLHKTAFLWSKIEHDQSIIDVLILKIINPSKDRKSRSQIINQGKGVKCCTVTALNDFHD